MEAYRPVGLPSWVGVRLPRRWQHWNNVRPRVPARELVIELLKEAGIYDEVRCKDVIVSEDGALTLIDRDPKNALPRLACAEHGALLCLARCDYLRLRGGATITSRDRLRVLASYCRASGGKYALASALPIVGAALDAELVRHRANGALVAEFGLLER